MSKTEVMTDSVVSTLDGVVERYSKGAHEREEALCCPVNYDAALLKMLPKEIIERDYGCGDPSRYVQSGDSVLDLGSGGGKICYMAAQIVGADGRITGVDMNDEMLALARRHQLDMAEKLGGDFVRFLKGFIEDLALDLQAMEAYLQKSPVKTASDYQRLQAWQDQQRRERPMIPDESVDLVISNCVLNLVRDDAKQQMVREIHRVLKPGGRIAISDIVSDQNVPDAMKQDPELWSGCISGAFQEKEFLDVFEEAGFQALCYDKWDAAPWKVVEEICFRSVTLTGVKPAASEKQCKQHKKHELFYRGPFAAVLDEAENVYHRGVRVSVDDRQLDLLSSSAYGGAFIGSGFGSESETSGGGCC